MMVCYASWHGIRPPNPDNIRYCLLSWMFVLRSLISHYLSTNIMRAIREYLCAFFFRASLSDSYSLISFRFSYQCFSNKEQCYILHKVWSRVWSWSASEILKLKFGQYFAAEAWWLGEVMKWMFGQDLKFKSGQNADIWLRFWILEFDQDLCKNLLLW